MSIFTKVSNITYVGIVSKMKCIKRIDFFPCMFQESENEDDKSKIVKIIPKKSQTVTTAHMCNYCNYTSPKRYLLSRHMKSHSEERPHKCSVCERGFKTLASLQNHVNTHTGTKPHQCKFCESAFTTSGKYFILMKAN